MADNFDLEQNGDRRKYPRRKAHCQLNYFARTTGSWSEGRLHDYSASGICFFCDELLSQDTKVTVQISESANADVPAMAASAVVVRCEQNDDRLYKVACRFTNLRFENKAKVSRLDRFGFR